jgi:hypothetical protein
LDLVNTSHPNYRSYLLRLWRAERQDAWRASLQCTATAQLLHFADVEAMLAFLVAELAAAGDDAGASEPANTDGQH